MIKISDFVFRLILFIGAYYNFLGYMWGGGKSAVGTPYEMYAASPWIALAIGALIPNGMLSRSSGKLLFFPMAILAVVRSIDQLIVDLTLANEPVYLAAIFRLVSIILLSAVVVKMYFLTKKSADMNRGLKNE